MAKTRSRVEGAFPLTRWSAVMRAGRGADNIRAEALHELLTRYAPALRKHLVYTMRLKPERAADLVQDFIAKKIIEKNLLTHADPERGRFRNFLLRSFQNYVISELRREKARRGAPTDSSTVSLDEYPDLLASSGEIEFGFDTFWAQQTLAETLARMHQECQAKGRTDIWNVFESRVLGPILSQADALAYEKFVAQFGFLSPSQAHNVLITAKRMFRRVLFEVVQETVADPAGVEAEIADLRRTLAGIGTRITELRHRKETNADT